MNIGILVRQCLRKPTLILGKDSSLGRAARIRNAGSPSDLIQVGANSRIVGELSVFAHGGRIQIGDWCFVATKTRLRSACSLNIGNGVLITRQCPSAFFTNGDDEVLQRQWARENGLPANAALESILLAQIEHQRTEVFYNIDPISFPGAFTRRLPASVKACIAWRAAPSGTTDFRGYSLLVCNFPGILEGYRRAGMRTAYFAPAFDPEMASYAANTERPIDILFVGGFSRHHQRRAGLLLAVAGLSPECNVVMHLDRSRLTAWAESALGRVLLPSRLRRPDALRHLAGAPVFGRDLYTVLSRAKIVVNAAIDMAGEDRGNIRCFEAMGTGGLLLSDAGRYPEGMADGQTIVTYADPDDLLQKARRLLTAPDQIQEIARRGHETFNRIYSKEAQWASFERLVASLPVPISTSKKP